MDKAKGAGNFQPHQTGIEILQFILLTALHAPSNRTKLELKLIL
jgi:hypothetical protein